MIKKGKKNVKSTLDKGQKPTGTEKKADINRDALLLSHSFSGLSPTGKTVALTVSLLGTQFESEATRGAYITDNMLLMAQSIISAKQESIGKKAERSTVLAASLDVVLTTCKALEVDMRWGLAPKGSDKETREAFHAAPKTYSNVKSIIRQSFEIGLEIADFKHISGKDGLEVSLQAAKVAKSGNIASTEEVTKTAANAAEQAIDSAIEAEASPELVAMVESVLALGMKLEQGQQDELVKAVNLAITPFKDVINAAKANKDKTDKTPLQAGTVS